ncbi:MAG: hypothetical protein JF615_07675, partial [Asticcacaulis sp.]|nr:hypothetical protein [Asticcacaulis sp.]
MTISKTRLGLFAASVMLAQTISPLSARAGTEAPGPVPPVSVTIDGTQPQQPVSRYEYGMFIEPIGQLVARTLWAEMLDDRKFYFPFSDGTA